MGFGKLYTVGYFKVDGLGVSRLVFYASVFKELSWEMAGLEIMLQTMIRFKSRFNHYLKLVIFKSYMKTSILTDIS